MSLETNPSLRLPVIDFTSESLKPGTPEWESVKSQVFHALEEFGCFEALFDKTPLLEIRKQVFESSLKELFDLPPETKNLHELKPPFKNNGGYDKTDDKEVPFESMTIDDAMSDKNLESFINIFWPQGNPSLRKSLQSYLDQLTELDQIVRRMVYESLGIEKYVEDHLDSSHYTVRVLKYKALEIGATKRLALPSHIDKRYINILGQNEVDGLEVQTKDGQWISCQLSKGSYMVNLGESFSAVLTNGRLHCPFHRVTMNGNKPRYTTVLISEPNNDYLIKTQDELVDDEHPLSYKPYYYPDYYNFMIDVKNIKPTLKGFCGV